MENITSMEMTDSPPAGKPESTFQSKFVHMYMIHQSELGQTHRNCGFSSDASELSRHSETLLGAMFWAEVRKPGSSATAGLSALRWGARLRLPTLRERPAVVGGASRVR